MSWDQCFNFSSYEKSFRQVLIHVCNVTEGRVGVKQKSLPPNIITKSMASVSFLISVLNTKQLAA